LGSEAFTPAQFHSAQNYENSQLLLNLSILKSNDFSDSSKPEIWQTELNNPETVPDRTAQSLFFLTISKLVNEGKEDFARKYIKLMGLINCPDTQCSSNISEQDVQKILSVVKEYEAKVASLDEKALDLKRKNSSSQLTVLQKQKLRELEKAVQKLSVLLRPETFSRFKDHINFRIKPKVKIVKRNASAQSKLESVNQINVAADSQRRIRKTKSQLADAAQLRPEDPIDDTGYTTEMSDVWVAPSSDSEEVLPEGTAPVFSTTIVGVGVSEADYDANVYQTSTTVSIVTDGNILATDNATGTFSAIAETQYTIETDFGTVSPDQPEVQYDIQSTHAYNDSPSYADYSFYSYSSAIIWVTFRYTGYIWAGMGFGGCSGQYPFGYSASCPFYDDCQKAKMCSRYVSNAIQGYGYRFRTIGLQWCQTFNLHVNFRPWCRG
jgi:hypothetical protein